MRVLVIDEAPGRAGVLRESLLRAGYEVAASLASPVALLKAIEQSGADSIVVDTDSPSRGLLERLASVTQQTPRPVIMFATDGAPDTIRDAVRAGVSAYVVDGLDP